MAKINPPFAADFQGVVLDPQEQAELLKACCAAWHAITSVLAVRDGITDENLCAVRDHLSDSLNAARDAMRAKVRSIHEVQRAHDILWGQITGATPFVFDDSARPLAQAALDTLCWVLRHNHADGFPRTLADIEAELERRGYRLEKLPE